MSGADSIRQVDRFIETEIEARALALAFSLGIIDRLLVEEFVAKDEIFLLGKMPEAAFHLFLDLLVGNEVTRGHETIGLTPQFRAALACRDLLEAKLWFANLVAPDIHGLFAELLSDIPQFMARARVFELFRYDRCMVVTPENLAATAQWVNYTTILTRYEAPSCLDRLVLAEHRQIMDIGGNSGEFVRQICERNQAIRATVFDLPVVCELGRRHVSGSPQAGRIAFLEGDLRNDPLPADHDVISFKSVLHDWPQEDAAAFIGKAAQALAPGGRIVIFERMPIELRGARLPYSMVANLVFLPFFRSPDFYAGQLDKLSFIDITVRSIGIEMPFALITARKKWQ
ncbi:methyltransferase [Mesorhizobium loti]|uniref:methyltransferase n=1 Tax=Rhizobium loti TaxID=381 RepID=UPI000421DA48|nr:methyltransferase [Mesorhizobium loti]